MNISLTPELEKLVNKKVSSGRYISASEVVREALRLLEDNDKIKALRVTELKRRIAAGVEQLDSGETRAFSSSRIKKAGRRRKSKRKAG